MSRNIDMNKFMGELGIEIYNQKKSLFETEQYMHRDDYIPDASDFEELRDLQRALSYIERVQKYFLENPLVDVDYNLEQIHKEYKALNKMSDIMFKSGVCDTHPELWDKLEVERYDLGEKLNAYSTLDDWCLYGEII